MKFTSLILTCMLASLALAQGERGDIEPYCRYPDIYPTSMKAIDGPIDAARYVGNWYEIRRMPTPRETQCICSSAYYSADPEVDWIYVDNTCQLADGTSYHAIGRAIKQNEELTKLKVYFTPTYGGNYWVLDLANDYSYVMVGEPCRKSLFILSRQTTLAQDILDRLISKAQSIGYDTSVLVSRDPSC